MSEVTAARPHEEKINPYRSVPKTAWDKKQDEAEEAQKRTAALFAKADREAAIRNAPEAVAARKAKPLEQEKRWAEEQRYRIAVRTEGTEEHRAAQAAHQAQYERETRHLIEDKEDRQKVAAFAEELRSARLKARAKEGRR